MAAARVTATTVHTSLPSVSSRSPGSSPVWQVGLQFMSSHESKRETWPTQRGHDDVYFGGFRQDGATDRPTSSGVWLGSGFKNRMHAYLHLRLRDNSLTSSSCEVM